MGQYVSILSERFKNDRLAAEAAQSVQAGFENSTSREIFFL
jgi:hypothetical protein